jgi:mannitol-specific phosphotransferase system IIBC component
MNPVRMGALILFIDSVKEAILQSKAKQSKAKQSKAKQNKTKQQQKTSASGDDTSTPNNQKLKIHFALQNGTTS